MSELRDEELDALLGKAALTHLTDEELELYHDSADDEFRRALTAAHLSHCLLCANRFATMQHTLATYQEIVVSPESVAQLKALLVSESSLSERLRKLAARLVERARELEQASQSRIRLVKSMGSGFVSGPPVFRIEITLSGPAPVRTRGLLSTFAVANVVKTYRFLTILDEDEAGEFYLFMGMYGEQKGPVYCWPVEGTPVELSVFPGAKERHRYQAYLTDREVPLPAGISLDASINGDDRNKERQLLVIAFLEALERGEARYRAAILEIKP